MGHQEKAPGSQFLSSQALDVAAICGVNSQIKGLFLPLCKICLSKKFKRKPQATLVSNKK